MSAELKFGSFSLESLIDEIVEPSSLSDPEEIKRCNFYYFWEQIDFDEVDHDDTATVKEALDCIEGIIGKQEGQFGFMKIVV